MSDLMEPEVIPWHRAGEGELRMANDWLMPRLKTIWPHLTEPGIRSALMGATVSPEEWIGCTENAILAARAVRENMTGRPYVKVWFALARNGEDGASEVAELHYQIVEWMKRGGMTNLILSPHMDGDRSFVRARIGKLTKHDVWMLHLGAAG